MYKVTIWISYRLSAAYRLLFKKTIDLPFAPFYGLAICFGDALPNTEILKDRSIIVYRIDKGEFEINVRESFNYAEDTEGLMGFIEDYLADGWTREDKMSENQLKSLFKK